MRLCKKCGIKKPLTNFGKQSRNKKLRRNTCYACKYKKTKDSGYLESTKEKRKEYQRQYHIRNPEVKRFKANRSFDLRNGFDTMSLENYRLIVSKPCYYCTNTIDIGLDRKDNNKGHTLKNSLPCCHKCNYLLSDIPMKAKQIMKGSLTEIFNNKLLDEWVVPTKRKKEK